VGRVVKNAVSSKDAYVVRAPNANGSLAPEPTVPSFDDGGFALPAPRFVAPAPDIDVARLEAEALAIVDGATASAEALLTEARDRARAILENAVASADDVLARANADGHAEGYRAGQDQASRENDEMESTMRGLIEMARVERHKIVESAEGEIVRLAMGIAERIVQQQVALDRGVVVEMTKAAVSRLLDRESITVRVNPADFERMREHREDVLALGDVAHMRIIEDQRVDRGGVVVETESGSVDARIATQVAEARRVLHLDDDIVVSPALENAPLLQTRAS
jgi:flagellar assembly protein FliH